MCIYPTNDDDSNRTPCCPASRWDQNLWAKKKFPTKADLDALSQEHPIALTRIDGHASFCNQAALDLGNVTINSTIDGGEVEIKNGKLTGILLDNAEQLVMNNWPEFNREQLIEALMAAQKICFENGLTTISDAGPDIFTSPWIETIELIDSLQKL